MLEVTLLNPADASTLDDQTFGRCIVAHDKEDNFFIFTRLFYMLLSLCSRDGVEEITLNSRAGDNCLQCRHANEKDYSIEQPPSNIQHYLVYHALLMACQTTFASRWYWALAQLMPGSVNARIHVRFEGTTYHWNAIFRRRTVVFKRYEKQMSSV